MREEYLPTPVVKAVKLSERAHLPERGSKSAAGYDLYSANEGTIYIAPGETKKISTDLALQIPEGYFGAIYARSGLATKQGLRPANAVGVIDSDYRGPVIVALHNDSDIDQAIPPQTRIAQLVIQPYLGVAFDEVDSLDDTERGEGGFGSTGTK